MSSQGCESLPCLPQVLRTHSLNLRVLGKNYIHPHTSLPIPLMHARREKHCHFIVNTFQNRESSHLNVHVEPFLRTCARGPVFPGDWSEGGGTEWGGEAQKAGLGDHKNKLGHLYSFTWSQSALGSSQVLASSCDRSGQTVQGVALQLGDY